MTAFMASQDHNIYILLLESADPRILSVIKKLLRFVQDNEYKVEKIIEYDF